MSDEEPLRDREKALEETFFARQNAELVERLRAAKTRGSARKGLEEAAGIRDAELLDRVVALGIGPETWPALSLIPLVEVAWAGGEIEEKERRAVRSVAEASGVVPGSAAFGLLEKWLTERPDARILEAWGEFIVTLCAKSSQSERAALEQEVLGRARRVAEAAGGVLGMGRISQQEEAVLEKLRQAFRRS